MVQRTRPDRAGPPPWPCAAWRPWHRRWRYGPWSCSLWPRQVGRLSRTPCSASPMPATLPWPKIAQTPSNETPALLGLLHREPAHHRLRRRQPYRVHAALSLFARASSQMRQSLSRSVVPSCRRIGIAESRRQASHARASPKIVPADRKALHQIEAARPGRARPPARTISSASRPSTTTPRVPRIVAGDGAQALSQAASVAKGSSFHQSGKTPRS